MSTQDDTLTQLNAAKSALTTMIIVEGAAQGTPEFQSMLKLVDQRDQITADINQVIASTFPADDPALTAAAAQLQARITDLQNVQKTLDKIGLVINVVDGVVQAATTVLGIVAAV
jgi:hypothetical protein